MKNKKAVIILLIIILLLIGLSIFFSLFSFNTVKDDSMGLACPMNSTVMIMKTKKIENNDIIYYKDLSNKTYIGRVVASNKEDINIVSNIIYVNGLAFISDASFTGTLEDASFNTLCNIEGCEKGVIPNDYYFVINDNRQNTLDSRDPSIGLINTSNVIGKVILTIK